MKIAFTTLGCKLNYAETSTYERGFVSAGWEVVPWTAQADVYLINTCAVTETAEKKSRNLIRRAHKTAPEGRIVVTGCYAQLRKEQLLSIDGVWKVFGATEKSHLVQDTLAGVVVGEPSLRDPSHASLSPRASYGPLPLTWPRVATGSPTTTPSSFSSTQGAESVREGGPDRGSSTQGAQSVREGEPDRGSSTQRAESVREGGPDEGSSTQGAESVREGGPDRGSSTLEAQSVRGVFGAYSSGGERTRSFLKVQDGCDNFCAYCTVPYARGRSRNIPICEVVEMARNIAAAGVKEVVLTGVNTGDFGRTTGESFLDLLKALNQVEGIERYRISSIEPNLITPEIVDWIATGTKFQRHFHIPLQSGSDTLLKKVGRRYNTELFASRIDYIRQAMDRPGEPKVFFGIDVIVGLPGETEELFQETYDFLKNRIRPAFIHVFPYSRRPGTRAAEWKDQVQDSVKTERVARLETLCEELHQEFIQANKGLPTTVLWESSVKNGLMGGYTSNYIRIEQPYNKDKVNTIEEIII